MWPRRVVHAATGGDAMFAFHPMATEKLTSFYVGFLPQPARLFDRFVATAELSRRDRNEWRAQTCPQTASAVRNSTSNFFHSTWSGNCGMPTPLENPHCGLTASCSTGRYFEAASTLRFIASTDLDLFRLGRDYAQNRDGALSAQSAAARRCPPARCHIQAAAAGASAR